MNNYLNEIRRWNEFMDEIKRKFWWFLQKKSVQSKCNKFFNKIVIRDEYRSDLDRG